MTWLLAFLLASPAAIEHYKWANEFFQQQRFAEAGEALDHSLQEDPNYVPALTLRGKLAMAFNHFDAARQAFERAAELAPESSYAQFMLGFFHYVDNDFVKAIPALEKASSLDPADTRAVFYLAMSQEGLARPDLAAALYEKAITLETRQGKSNPETHTAYGRLLFSLGRFEESEQQVARVLAIDPASRDGHYERGRLRFESGAFEQAAVEGEKALAAVGIGTTDRQIHFLLVRVYSRLGKKELAELHRMKFEISPPTLRR
jgi:tetratricopeptide (TPR) repeat protein